MSESFHGSLAERRGSGNDVVERVRRGAGGVVKEVATSVASRLIIAGGAALIAGKGIPELMKTYNHEPDDNIFSGLDDLDLDSGELALISFLGIGAILATYLLYIGLRPQPGSSKSPVYETPTWRRAQAA